MAIKCPKCDFENLPDSKYCKECSTPLRPAEDFSDVHTKTLKKPEVDSPKGTLFADRYRIIEELGRGGMGVVYKAEDTRLERTVALKFLPPEWTRLPEAKERFIREAKAAAGLDHPNICTIHEIDEAEDQTFISMAYIKGQTLKDKIQKGPINLDTVLDIAIQIASGLQEAHEKGIVHRDIKSSNIMVTGKGEAKIMDFGLAKSIGQSDLTKPATIMGSVSYMSPEQVRGKEIDLRTDIWAFGVILYEMITGQLPFKSERDEGIFYAITHEDPEPLASLCVDVPRSFELVINHTLAKNPEERYQHIGDVLSDLNAIKENLEVREKQGPSIIVKRQRTKRFFLYGSVSILTALIIITGLYFIFFSGKAIDTIAILPFEIIKTEPDPDIEFICDSISQDLINKLEPLSSLKKVIAWDSVRNYKGKEVDSFEVGQELDVKAVLKSSMILRGEVYIIRTELMRTSDRSHIWGEQFQFRQNISEIFAFQEDISDAIIENLKLRLSGEEHALLTKRYTENTEAYLAYQRGLVFLDRRSLEGFAKAIENFNKAINLDPVFAPAYVGLAAVYGVQGAFNLIPSLEAYSMAKREAERAIAIDDKLAQAHAELAVALAYGEWDWSGAEEEFQKAIRLNEGNSDIQQTYGQFMVYMGRAEEGIEALRRAVEIDPISLPRNMFLGVCLCFVRQYDDSIEQLQKTLEIYPNSEYAHFFLSWAYFFKSMIKEAIAEVQEAITLGGRQPMFLGYLGSYFAAAGEEDKAMEILQALTDISNRDYVPPTIFAWFYARLGQIEKAITWLERAYEERDHGLIYLKVWQAFDSMRSHPRFQDLMRRMNFPD